MDKILKYAVENDMIDLSHIQECIEMQQRKELLERHPYKIYESKDGKWCTYLPDKRKEEFPKTRAGWRTVVIPQVYQWICGALREMSGEEEYVFTGNQERMTTACIRAR